MLPNLESLWDDENFTVQMGHIPGRASISGAELGTGIVYYPIDTELSHRVVGSLEEIPSARSSFGGLNLLWNTGLDSEIFNPLKSSSRFIRVGLKPSPELTAELPEPYFGPASAALLQDEWDNRFKESVRDDLEVIHGFVEPLRSGHTPSPEFRERATLAKEDLDLKLLWSAREYNSLGLFTSGHRFITLAAATPATGLINVTVHTKDTANAAMSGCLVWYVSLIKRSKPGFYRSFSKFSTPTSEQMAVGNYDMWTEKSGKQGPRRVVSVVSTSTTQSIDLLAP